MNYHHSYALLLCFLILLLLLPSETSSSSPSAETTTIMTTTTTTTTTTARDRDRRRRPRRRRLALGDFADFNRILRGAVLRLPDTEFHSDGARLKLSNVRCRNLSLGDADLSSSYGGPSASASASSSVEVNLRITNLDMSCRAEYRFSAWWLFGGGGSGTSDIRSSGSDAVIKGRIVSNDMKVPPEKIEVLTCNPTVFIDEVSFSNGGLFGRILNIFRGLLADFVESQARSVICAQLRSAMEDDAEGLLRHAKRILDEYKPENGGIRDPLYSEKHLLSLTLGGEWIVSDETRLLKFRDNDDDDDDDDTMFARWLESSVNRVVNFLSTPAEDPTTGVTDMQANIMLRQKVLDNDGALEIESSDFSSGSSDYDSGIVYEGHNRIAKTSVRFDRVRMVGLDSLTEFNPLDSIGDYTFQNQIAWDYLGFRIQATIEMTPSTSSDSIIETTPGGGGTRIEEQVEVFLGFDDLVAELSIISLFDVRDIQRIKLGSLLEKDNILPCLLSTILYADITSFSVDVADVLTPTITGFVSPGIDRIFSSGMEAGFLVYEEIVLNAAPRYFQEKIRPFISETFVTNNIGDSVVCTPSDWSGSASSNDLIDFRDLLLPPADALFAGATGLEPYGNVLSSFAMPYLNEKVFQGELFNANYIRPFTKSQSGTEGSLVFSDTLFQYSDAVPSSLYDSLVLTISDLRFHNVDTVVGPMSVLDPVDWNTLFNTISFDGSNGDNNTMNMTVRISLTIDGNDSPLGMHNTFDLNLSIPSSALSFEILASLRESSVMNFPVFDLVNYHCWLATLDSPLAESLILSGMSLHIDSFQLGSSCVSCSSPGIGSISEILQNLEIISGFNVRYQDDIVAMLVDMITDYTQNFDIEGLIAAAPKHCPHHPSYNPAAKVAGFPWPGLPALRSDSAETALAIGSIALYCTLIGTAKNQLLLAEVDAKRPSNEIFEMEYPEGSRIVNWTTLDGDLGDWAGIAFEELRGHLKRTVREPPNIGRRSGRAMTNLQVNEMLREHVLDSDGVYTMKFNEMGFDALDVELRLNKVDVYGLDSIVALDPLVLVPSSPQMLMNSIQFEALSITFELEVRSNLGEVKLMTVSHEFQGITAQVNMFVALDLARLEGIQLGSIFDMGRILSCAVSGVQNVHFSTLDFRFESIGEGPVINGYFSDENHQNIQYILHTLFDVYRADLMNGAPLLFNSTLREIMNAMLPKGLESTSRQCLPPANYSSTDTIDFRDLLLPPADALFAGATGLEPYGNVFSSFAMPYLNEKVFQGELFNANYIRPFTKSQSGTEGSLVFSDTLLQYSDTVPSSLYDSLVLTISDLRFHNVDTVVGPMSVLDPVDWNTLFNTISFDGSNGDNNTMTMTVRISLTIDGNDSPLGMHNTFDLNLSIHSSALSFEILASLRESSVMNFPVFDLVNYHCWLATLDSPLADSLILSGMSLHIDSFQLGSSCVSCSSPGIGYISEILQNLEVTSGFNVRYQDDIVAMLVDMITDYTQNFDIEGLIAAAPKHCPHHPSYNPAAKVAGFPWPGLPALRSDSAETALAIGSIALYCTLIGTAKNQLLLAEVDAKRPSNEIFEMEYPEGSHIVNWTTLDGDLGDWAGIAFEELRGHLKRTVREPPNIGRRSGRAMTNLQVNEMLREHVLDSDGVYTMKFNEMGFDALDVELRLNKVDVYGLDSIVALDPLVLVPSSPQMLMNSIQFEALSITFELEVRSNLGEVKLMTVSHEFQGITAQVNMFVALDLARLEGIQLGSIFDMGRILSCAVSGVQNVHFSTLDFRFESIGEGPVINGYFSDENHQNIQYILHTLFDVYRADLMNGAPLLFNSTLREIMNAMLPKVLESTSRQCLPPANYSSTDTIDFRDLFLSETLSSSFGGSAESRYGNLFRTMYDFVQKNILQTGASNRPLINDLLRQVTDGSLTFQGNSLDNNGRIKIAGLDATFGVVISDVVIQNIDSVGDPLDIFRPVLGEANVLNNTVSLGVDSKSLCVTGRIVLSLFDGAGIQMRNEMIFAVSFENVVLVAPILLLLSEEKFAAFPLRDLTNIRCWLSMILSKEKRSSRLRGIDLVDPSLSVDNFSLDVNCTSCTSPRFDELLSSLYNFSNTSEAIASFQDKVDNLLDADFIQVFLDHVVDDSASKCPHRPEFDPDALQEELLLSTAETFGLLQEELAEKPIHFTVINSAIAGFILMLGILCRWIVGLRNKQWIESLSREGHLHLELQQKKEQRMIEMINTTTTSLFNSETISKRVRYGVLLVLALNLGLLLGAHLGVLYVVDVDVSVAGEEFTINRFLEYRFLESTKNTYKNGGAEMVILIWIFAVIWPYIKIFLSLAMWVMPPTRLGVESRGRILLWIDAAAKLSVIDIFTVIVMVALLLVFIGGRDESYISEDMLYSLKVRTSPGFGFYSMIVAQRISRTSSRFYLEYHEEVIKNAAKEEEYTTETPEIDDNNITSLVSKNPAPSPSNDVIKPGLSGEGDMSLPAGTPCCTTKSPVTTTTTNNHDNYDGNDLSNDMSATIHVIKSFVFPSHVTMEETDAAQSKLQDKESSRNFITSLAKYSCDSSIECKVSSIQFSGDGRNETKATTKKEARWGIIGVYFGATTIVIVFIIGAIFAPSMSLDASSMAALAIESDMTCEEVVQNYGVFLVVSGVLLKARFVFDDKANYMGFGLLLVAGVVSVGAIFIMKVYKFIQQKMKGKETTPTPSFGHRGCGIPLYTRLTKWRYMEIYLISFAVGIWQLGAISSYSIHLYCNILSRIFESMAFLGLVEQAPTECYNIQASLPENLGIILGSFGVLLASFILQAFSRYRKNTSESVRWIDNDDVPRLSQVWSQGTSKNTKYSFITSLGTSSMSRDSTEDPMGTPPGSPSTTRSEYTSSKPSNLKVSSSQPSSSVAPMVIRTID